MIPVGLMAAAKCASELAFMQFGLEVEYFYADTEYRLPTLVDEVELTKHKINRNLG